MTNKITNQEKRKLIAKAHHLKPVVIIGHKGLSESVMAETDRALYTHKLIKIKISSVNKTFKQQIINQIADSLSANPLSNIGNIVIFFRNLNLEDIK